MKTRKVGRVLSLLLAIAMVVGLMIPASSVLAETARYANVTWTEVENYTELKTAVTNAHKGETTYIKLNANISMPQGPYTDPNNEDKGWFVGEVIVLKEYLDMKQVAGMKYPDKNLGLDQLETALSAQGVYPIVRDVRPFSDDGQTGEFCIPVLATNVAKLEDLFDFEEDKWTAASNSNKNTKDYPSYDDVSLVIYDGTDVVIDLNNNNIDGNSDKAYTGTPTYSQTIFVVNGKLTIVDLSVEGNGSITGGTGYIAPGTYEQGISEPGLHGHLNYKENWSYINSNGHGVGVAIGRDPKWHICTTGRYSYWMKNATECRGGAVYVAEGGIFTLENGSITENCAWMEPGRSKNIIFKSDVNAVVKGGGVYVEAGATFNMYGGEVTKNAARSYQKDTAKTAYAYGGGVYLAPAVKNSDGTVAIPGAHMEFTGGKIAGNAVYAETNKETNVVSQGAGVYIAEGATLNMLGAAEASGATTDEMLASFPQVTDNSCGATNRDNSNNNMSLTAEGAGIYNAGTLNIRKAVVSANDFSEFSRDDMDTTPVGVEVVSVVRDEQTGLAQYTDKGELKTEKLAHETSGKFGVGRGSSRNIMITNGAGVCVTDTGTMNIGERTWIYDNWDLVTRGHKAFGDTRNYTRHWDAEKGEYVYDTASTGAGNGYCWSDTRDDVYLSGDRVMYIGEDLFECKIGVNYDRMVGARAKDSEAVEGKPGQASNRVIVRMSDDLDSSVWGEKSYAPRNRDIQFFFLNDNNKNWEHNNPEATGNIAYEVGDTPENATFPQRSMEILNAEGKAGATELHSDEVVTGGYDSSKYMNYKVYWDNGDTTRTDYPNDGTFGTLSAPVLRFAEMNRKSYLTFEFPEANKIFYGQPYGNTTDYTYNTEMRYLSYIDGFDNADKTSLPSREVNILMPDYAVYKSGVLSGITVGSPNSITNGADGKEAEDLYFKGWSFYTSYGYGPETVCPTNGRDKTTVTKDINNIATRGMFNIDVENINNDNVNAQLCPSFVAQWYTAEELAEARSRISGVKMQRVILKDESEALRLIAVVGQQYAEYDSAGFVISKTNATPTVEGGYDYSIRTAIYGKVLTKNNSTNGQSVYVSSSDIMSEEEFANGKGILYTNLKMTTDDDKATVYYVTPYAYVKNTDTYYYGKSRAVSYNYAYQMDVENGISPATE